MAWKGRSLDEFSNESYRLSNLAKADAKERDGIEPITLSASM